MELKLSKPICFFDLETTGTQTAKDRIVEIAVLKIHPNKIEEQKRWLIHPEISIPKEASKVHGITNEMVKNCPTFKEVAHEIYEFMSYSDWAGYNSNRFDLPLLAEEFLRAGIDFDLKNTRMVDVQVIFHKMEQRTLSAAYKFYCQKELIDAHSAMADVLATYEVLKGQLEKYPELENDVRFLEEFTTQKQQADLAGFIGLNEHQREVINFGKYKGEEVENVFTKDPTYYHWIQNADFPLYTKKVFTSIYKRKQISSK